MSRTLWLLSFLPLLLTVELSGQEMDVDYFQDTTMLIAGSLADSVDGGRPSVGARFAGPLDRINHKKNSIEVSPVRLGVFLNIGYYRMIDLRYAVGL